MALPRYKQCCMCTDVRTGAIILAMIGILGAGFSVISDSVGLGYYAPMIEDRIEDEKIASMAKFQEERPTSEEDIAQYQAYWQRLDYIKELVPWVFTAQIISSVSNILVNGCMLFGVTKKKPGFILPWLIISMTCIVLIVSLLSLGFFVMCIGTPAGILNGVILVLLTSPFVGLMMYFWLVVRSVYLDIRETKVTKPVGVDHEAQIEKAGGKYMKM